MGDLHRFVRVDFERFKAFMRYSLHLRRFNILVGPNNCGKSTILAAFRILAAAMRKATSRNPEVVSGPNGDTRGHFVDLGAISVADENIFYNYNDSYSASVRFRLSNGNCLSLYFPPQAKRCSLIAESPKRCDTPSTFRSQFNCPIGFVPILGPVEQNEQLFEKKAARLALFNYQAARNFRNIWHHYPERFDEFRDTLVRTWPGMDIQRPEVTYLPKRSLLHMFCPEERIPREICWAGFGFQVWCQMLTHLIQSQDKAVFLIDEPDIYLHADLQRQLFGLLRNLGPDILVATHSTEIITEADPDDIVLVNKARRNAKRLKNPSDLFEVFHLLGSNLNPILTQLARTRRAVFVEGKDFQILSKFAQRLNKTKVSIRNGFAVVPVEGFNPQKIRSLKLGMEATLGGKILAAAILDRDYRSDAECTSIAAETQAFCDVVTIHKQKEIENYLLVPEAIDRAASRRLADQAARSGRSPKYTFSAVEVLEGFAAEKKEYVTAQYLAKKRQFERVANPGTPETTITETTLKEFGQSWQTFESRMSVIPGKDALSALNQQLQNTHKDCITPTAIIDAMRLEEVPQEIQTLITTIDQFASGSVGPSTTGDDGNGAD